MSNLQWCHWLALCFSADFAICARGHGGSITGEDAEFRASVDKFTPQAGRGSRYADVLRHVQVIHSEVRGLAFKSVQIFLVWKFLLIVARFTMPKSCLCRSKRLERFHPCQEFLKQNGGLLCLVLSKILRTCMIDMLASSQSSQQGWTLYAIKKLNNERV